MNIAMSVELLKTRCCVITTLTSYIIIFLNTRGQNRAIIPKIRILHSFNVYVNADVVLVVLGQFGKTKC